MVSNRRVKLDVCFHTTVTVTLGHLIDGDCEGVETHSNILMVTANGDDGVETRLSSCHCCGKNVLI